MLLIVEERIFLHHMTTYVHTIMQKTDDIDQAFRKAVHNEVTSDMQYPVLCRKLTGSMSQSRIVPEGQERVMQQRGVAVMLLLTPPLEGEAQNIFVIDLRLMRENEGDIRGGHRDSVGGHVGLCPARSV